MGKKLILKHLKEIQKNDCLAFNNEEIGKERYFIRKFFIKKDRESNMREFHNLIDEKPKLLNRTIDCEDQISKLY